MVGSKSESVGVPVSSRFPPRALGIKRDTHFLSVPKPGGRMVGSKSESVGVPVSTAHWVLRFNGCPEPLLGLSGHPLTAG